MLTANAQLLLPLPPSTTTASTLQTTTSETLTTSASQEKIHSVSLSTPTQERVHDTNNQRAHSLAEEAPTTSFVLKPTPAQLGTAKGRRVSIVKQEQMTGAEENNDTCSTPIHKLPRINIELDALPEARIPYNVPLSVPPHIPLTVAVERRHSPGRSPVDMNDQHSDVSDGALKSPSIQFKRRDPSMDK